MPSTPAQPTTTPIRTVALLMACGALAGGLAEYALRAASIVLPGLFGTRVLLDPQSAWLAPLTNFVLLAPIALVLLAIGRRWPASRLIAVTAFIATLAALLEPMLITQRIHVLAMLALGAGAATQVARWASARPVGFMRVARVLTSLFACTALALTIAFNGWRMNRERRMLGALPSSPQGAPNVILLVLDTVRSLELSLYGYHLPTSPALERMAPRGARFDQAIATAPWTLPSHASMLTGRYPTEMSAGWTKPLDGAHPTLAERLAARGYATGGFVANLAYTSYQFGLWRGFARYEDYAITPSEAIGTTTLGRRLVAGWNAMRHEHFEPGRKSAARINQDLLRWIDERRESGRPFFAFANYYDAHAPYVPPAPFDPRFAPGGRRPIIRDIPYGRKHTAEEVAALQAAYDESIAYLDARIGELFAELERRNLLGNTIIVVTSDHGEEFEEHASLNHGNSLYIQNLRVPLLVLYPPRVPAGTVVSEPVTLRDLAATILDLTGTAGDALPGQSLAHTWTHAGDAPSSAPAPSPILSELENPGQLPAWYPITKGTGSMRSIVVGPHHLIRRGDRAEEMYDIIADPAARAELLQGGSHRAAADSARAALDAALAQARGR
jgi:arylsulfatase A-like enzyme